MVNAMEQMKKISISSLEAVKQAVEEDKLTENDIMEFYDAFKDDIILMLEKKIDVVAELGWTIGFIFICKFLV